MLHRFITVAAWSWLLFIAFATLSPITLRPHLTVTESGSVTPLEHIGAFALLALLLVMSYASRFWAVCALVFGSAIILELLQIFVPGRDARLIDAAEKLAGGGIGILVAYWLSSATPLARAFNWQSNRADHEFTARRTSSSPHE